MVVGRPSNIKPFPSASLACITPACKALENKEEGCEVSQFLSSVETRKRVKLLHLLLWKKTTLLGVATVNSVGGLPATIT